MPHYPAFLDLRGRRVLVAGGGAVALRKVRALRGCGAKIVVVAPQVHPGLGRLEDVAVRRRAFRAADLAGAALVFAATSDANLNARIAQAAQAQGVWVNVAAPPQAGNLIVPACLRRGNLVLAISTGGASAAAARSLRQELQQAVGREWAVYLDLLRGRREAAKRRIADPRKRRALLKKLGGSEWLEKLRRHGRRKVAAEMDRLVKAAAQPQSRRR